MHINQNFTEAVALVASLAPASQSVAPHTVGPFQNTVGRRLVAKVHVGAIAGGATVDFKLQASTTQGGSYTDITGAAITRIAAGTDKVAFVEVKAETIQGQGLGNWIQGVLTVGTAVAVVDVEIFAVVDRYGPASDYNASAVAEIVVV